MAQKMKADPHIAEAEKALKEAIEQSNMGHADAAGKAAENALSQLKMAFKEKNRPGGCPEGRPCEDEDKEGKPHNIENERRHY